MNNAGLRLKNLCPAVNKVIQQNAESLTRMSVGQKKKYTTSTRQKGRDQAGKAQKTSRNRRTEKIIELNYLEQGLQAFMQLPLHAITKLISILLTNWLDQVFYSNPEAQDSLDLL
ncbi:hypothetical protein JGF61_23725 [Salmonella enterica subsp. enterica serovar Agona]|nr:hypothetical protein [Salmonella enterica subsp. enterica serovar Agona]